jgi:hypothetical protein
MRSTTALLPALIIAALCLAAPLATAQPFTYQGQLTVGGLPATAAQDLEFRVFDTATAGTQIGSTTTVLNVTPSNGVFTATVSPGNGVFTGADRWLEVSARASGPGAYTTLTPRQQITATPYAARSLSERLTDIGGGTLTNDPAQVERLLFNRTTPITGSDYFTLRTPTTAGQFGGMYVETAAADGRPFYGFATNGQFRSYVYYQPSTSSVVLWNNGDHLTINNTGQFGLGLTPSGTERLQVSGAVRATGAISASAVSVTGLATAANFAYPAPQTRYLTVGPEAFHSVTTGATRLYTLSQALVGFDAAVTSAALMAPISLPQGAVIQELRAYLRDNSATADITMQLSRRLVGTNSQGAFYFLNSTGSSGVNTVYSSFGTEVQTVDNQNYQYYLHSSSTDWNGANMGINMVQVVYTVPNAD